MDNSRKIKIEIKEEKIDNVLYTELEIEDEMRNTISNIDNLNEIKIEVKEEVINSNNSDIDKLPELKNEIRVDEMGNVLHTELATGANAKTPIICTYCHKTFKYKTTLTDHMNLHTGEKPYHCTHCDKAFSFNIELMAHLQICSMNQVIPYQCSLCNKAFSSKYFLQKHKTIHSRENAYQCNTCDKTFSLESQLIRHTNKCIHTRARSTQCSPNGIAFSEKKDHMTDIVHCVKKPYKCCKCDITFSQEIQLTRHMGIHTEESSNHCKKYEIAYSEKVGLMSRTITKNRQHKCSHCYETFPSIHTLEKHEKIHPVNKLQYCLMCNNAYLSGYSLNRHVRNVHTKKRLYQCSKCDMSFSIEIHLNSHMSIHNEGRPNQCSPHEHDKVYFKNGFHKSHVGALTLQSSISTPDKFHKKKTSPSKGKRYGNNDSNDSKCYVNNKMKHIENSELNNLSALKVEVKEEVMDITYSDMEKLPEHKIEIKEECIDND